MPHSKGIDIVNRFHDVNTGVVLVVAKNTEFYIFSH